MEESIVISVIDRNKLAKLTEKFFHVVGPEKFEEAFKQYKGILFPAEKYDNIKYIKKARSMFDKLRGKRLTLKPLGR